MAALLAFSGQLLGNLWLCCEYVPGMSQAPFENAIFIEAEPERVARFLTTMSEHTSLHPLIVAIEEEPSAPGDAPGSRRYRIRDRLRMGPFTFHIQYRATVWRDASGDIVSDAYQFPAVRLHNVTRCRAEGQGTRVEERVLVRAPWPLLGYVVEQARRSHQRMLENLKALLERGANVPEGGR